MKHDEKKEYTVRPVECSTDRYIMTQNCALAVTGV